MTEKGKVVGYESVRSCPSRTDIKRAEKLYAAINAGKFNARHLHYHMVALAVMLLLSWLLYNQGFAAIAMALLTEKNALSSIKTLLANAFSHQLVVRFTR